MAENDQVVDEQVEGTEGAGEPSPEVVQEARMLGWVPREQFRGRTEDWVDAQTFVDKGKHVLPILKANNTRLMDEIRQRDMTLAEVQGQLRAQTAALKALEDNAQEDAEATRVAQVADLESEIERALADGDHKAVAKATTQLTELHAKALVQAQGLGTGQDNANSGVGVIDPATRAAQVEVLSWFDLHPDYKEGRKGALANAIIQEMRAKGDRRVGRAILDDVANEVEAVMSGSGGGNRVSSGNGGTSRNSPAGGGGPAKSYADLPADAKAACDKMVSRFVGAGKRYQTADAWRKAYAVKYFSE